MSADFVKPLLCLNRRVERVYQGLCLRVIETLISELNQPLLGVSLEQADTARLPSLPDGESKQ